MCGWEFVCIKISTYKYMTDAKMLIKLDCILLRQSGFLSMRMFFFSSDIGSFFPLFLTIHKCLFYSFLFVWVVPLSCHFQVKRSLLEFSFIFVLFSLHCPLILINIFQERHMYGARIQYIAHIWPLLFIIRWFS